MKLMKMTLLAAFIPALAFAQAQQQPMSDPGQNGANPSAADQNPSAADQSNTDTSNANQYNADQTKAGRSLGESLFGVTVKPGAKNGLEVAKVDSGSSAEKAGIKAGDVITKVDDMSMTTKDDLARAWAKDQAAMKQEASIQVVRDQQPKDLQVKLEAKSATQNQQNQPAPKEGM